MFHSLRSALSILFVATVASAAGTGCSGGGAAPSLRGGVEKGPFILGSSVTASVVDAQGNPTGTSYATQTTDQAGSFSLANVPVGGVSFQADGFYYDEVLGTLSTAPITLRSFYDVTSGTPRPAFINVVTHLAHDRVQVLLGEGTGIDAAIPQAEGELVTALGIGPSGFTLSAPGSSLDEMGGDDDPNAYLFALSAVFLQASIDAGGLSGPVDATLQQMLDEVAAGLAASGTLTPALIAPLQTAAGEIDVPGVESLFAQYLASIGVSATVPDLTRILSGTTTCTSSTTLQGSFTITNSLDVATLVPYHCVTGDLLSGWAGATSLPNLRQVGGQLNVGIASSIDMPLLTSIGGNAQFPQSTDLPLLTTIGGAAQIPPSSDLPLLATIGGAAQISAPWNLPALATVGDLNLLPASSSAVQNLPALTTAGQINAGISFTAPLLAQVTGIALDAATLPTFSLPSLTTIGSGGLSAQSAPAGLAIDLPALTASGGTIAVANQTLSVPVLVNCWGFLFSGPYAISLPALTSVGNLDVTGQVMSVSAPVLATQYGYMGVYGTANLATLSFPALTTSAGIAIYPYPNTFYVNAVTNQALTTIDFPVLTSAGVVLEVFDNPVLPQCQIDALHAQLVADGWTGTYTAYSNGTGTCP